MNHWHRNLLLWRGHTEPNANENQLHQLFVTRV